MAVVSGEECGSNRSVVVLPEGGNSDTKNEPPSSLTSLEVHKLMKNQILDVDIEKGEAEIPNINEEANANLKSDDFLTRTMPREICLHIGGKFTQLLMNHGTELPKFTSRDKLVAERARKYKRSASFNSRRVVLMFSVLSSMGTLVLIYLTLRVRQISGNI